jgi:Acetyltransferase (GNAT) domain
VKNTPSNTRSGVFDRYAAFCAAAPDLPLFMHDWYLDAVCSDGHWDAAMVEKGGKMVAVWPYFLKKKWAWPYVAMPLLGRMMGPYVLPEYRTLRHEPGLYADLLAQLPPLVAFEQDFNPTVTNWLPFYWAGFRQTTRYSYILPLQDLDACYQGMAADYRNHKIPKAAAQVVVQAGLDLTDFLRVHNQSFERQGLEAPVSAALLTRLDAALAERDRRAILLAVDRQTGEVLSAAYIAWDNTTAYYLLAGDTPSGRSSGAGILLAWEAIQYAKTVRQLEVFDFAGSMVRPIERVRRQFGAQQQPYFRLNKEWGLIWRWAKRLKG